MAQARTRFAVQEESITLTVGGTIYSGWTEVEVTRGIDRMAGNFHISVTEGWAGTGSPVPWQIKPFSPCTVAIGRDLVLTGYVDAYEPGYSATAHHVAIRGRSKTEDLVDCAPEVKGGQFSGYRLDAIARAICALFGIGVVVETDVGDPFPDATVERAETAYAYLERLCRMRGVLACDDSAGNLVLTRAGSQRGASALVEGENILAASATFDAHKRFSKYIIRGQHGITAEYDEVATDIEAAAADSTCPRYRPHVSMAESQLSPAEAKERAMWQAVYATGRAIRLDVTCQGWRQADGSLWTLNRIHPVTSPRLALDRDLLVVSTTFSLKGGEGRRTRLSLGPAEGYTPDPAQVRHRRGHGNGGGNWHDIKGIK